MSPGRWVRTLAVVAVAWACPLVRAQDRPTFRSSTTAIAVNVSVRSGNTPVAGLTARDFDVRDNGVAQTITDVSVEAVPIDVTLIVDTSGSTVGVVERLKKDAREIAGVLRTVDRLRLLTIDSYVNEIVKMQPAGRPLRLDNIPGRGKSSVHDALLAAMISRADPDRRHLIVAMTDGQDTQSALEATGLPPVAARSEGVLHIILVRPPPSFGPRSYPSWTPHVEQNLDALSQAAMTTGGELHWDSHYGTGAVAAFRKVFEDFRRSYVVRYTPTGVASRGWHELTVAVGKPGKYTVRARRGYFAG